MPLYLVKGAIEVTLSLPAEIVVRAGNQETAIEKAYKTPFEEIVLDGDAALEAMFNGDFWGDIAFEVDD